LILGRYLKCLVHLELLNEPGAGAGCVWLAAFQIIAQVVLEELVLDQVAVVVVVAVAVAVVVLVLEVAAAAVARTLVLRMS
jgi:hypothetical protein